MNGQIKWTESEFNAMPLQDCQVNSIASDQDGVWQNDLVLDNDFIVEYT